ncbi:GGDEF domain-containing protein [Clostridium algidicarnis]|uniref:GGDEF domain-containing protein n=1 Tax=Clostridium algidicarnis TaxID=37659 RepID=UPI001C0B3531|nr:GGDEF domain-containing protein [Clostridium algidicarnis]MBU3208076.1 GGDEF domain-containing protein [Clostridium algidicarnis]MBU3227693.1 GGDEF domain-containing protein [Clostridium algidicarnis]MBU3250900.1 GGDEF domain-containing protein [Clostridium algidicarnis]
MNSLEDIIKNVKLLENLYDDLRIVDPIKKKVVYHKGINNVPFNENCYDFWRKKSHCENCISSRALVEKDNCVKIEYTGNKVLLIMSTKILYSDNRYILETFKDITNIGVIADIENKSEEYILSYIKDMNNKIIRDDLTGIYNRRYINDKLPVDILSVKLSKIPCTVVMIDIDDFKIINDENGHIIGDNVLKDFSQFISNEVNSVNGWIGRYGGEEFFISLPNMDKEHSLTFIEEIRLGIENLCFNYEKRCLKVTISGGIYEIKGSEEIDEVFRNADNRLYNAKHKGKNRIEM